MRAADLDELNEAAPEGIGGPVWVYFLDDKGGFRADWVLVWATPHPDSGLTRARIRYVGRDTQHNEPGWGEGFCGVTCRGPGPASVFAQGRAGQPRAASGVGDAARTRW